MSAIIAIDPGTTQSAWVMFDTEHPDEGMTFGIESNEVVLDKVRRDRDWYWSDVIVIEQVASYGMPVGVEVFETVRWAGRFEEAAYPRAVERITRLQVKTTLCHSAKANDATIRRALMDRYGGDSSIKKGGPLYGVSKDVWAALAVAVAWSEREAEAAA